MKLQSRWFAYLLAAFLAFASFESAAFARGRPSCEPHLSLSEHADINRMLKGIDRNLADDAFQEAMIAYHKKCASGGTIEKPFEWLKVVSRNKLLTMMQKEKRRGAVAEAFGSDPIMGPRSPDPWPRPTVDLPTVDELAAFKAKILGDLLRQDTAPILLEAGKGLSDKLKDERKARILYNRHIEGMGHAEIAALENIPESKVQSTLRTGERAIDKVIASTAVTVEDAGWRVSEFWIIAGTLGLVIIVAIGLLAGYEGFSEAYQREQAEAARRRQEREDLYRRAAMAHRAQQTAPRYLSR